MVFLFIALAFSLGVHLLFLKNAEHWVIVGFSPTSYDLIVPRTFKMKRVELDPKTLENPKEDEKTEPSKMFPVALPKEEPGVETLRNTPEKTYLSKPVPLPQQDPMEEMRGDGEKGGMVNALSALPRSDVELELPTNDSSMLSQQKFSGSTAGRSSSAETHAFSSLDDLLAGKAAVSEKTAPILMPTDLLFGYDSETLRPEAEQTLEKLGSLIKKNVQADFRIEGHTDSFGSDIYNDALSQRRAEAVKHWLQEKMQINGGRISTVGFGKRHLLAPSTGTVQEQQLNRRVEIVISTHPGT